jgi:hypothetical protein
VWDFPLANGDILVLLTDGISSRFELEEFVRLELTVLAEELLGRHHKGAASLPRWSSRRSRERWVEVDPGEAAPRRAPWPSLVKEEAERCRRA